ncbi:hypothetical protein AAY473_011327 [Plecturocebus cupreus]
MNHTLEEQAQTAIFMMFQISEKLEFNDMISVHHNLRLPSSSDSPASASQTESYAYANFQRSYPQSLEITQKRLLPEICHV